MFKAFKKSLTNIQNWLIADRKRIVRVIVLIVCFVVVIFQTIECILKLSKPPITTHSRADLNDSMTYPALTFCRDPSYKADVLAEVGLAYHPKMTRAWQDFPFNTTDLDELFLNATYEIDDNFYFAGLDGNTSHIQITSSMTLEYGRCYTLMPLVTTEKSWKSYGYSIFLKHTESEQTDLYVPGWHLFIHESKETFTEHNMDISGRVEYLFINVNEEIEIKLSPQEFLMVNQRGTPCADLMSYSSTNCTEYCRVYNVTHSVGCSGPWISGSDLKYCDNYNDMRNLIVTYNNLNSQTEKECRCMDPCKTSLFSAYVMNRKLMNIGIPSSQVYVYFTSKVVQFLEEKPGYDWYQFIADMGGSLGFLLGLSVLGLIGILEKIILLLIGICIFPTKRSGELENSSPVPHNGEISAITAEMPVCLNQQKHI